LECLKSRNGIFLNIAKNLSGERESMLFLTYWENQLISVVYTLYSLHVLLDENFSFDLMVKRKIGVQYYLCSNHTFILVFSVCNDTIFRLYTYRHQNSILKKICLWFPIKNTGMLLAHKRYSQYFAKSWIKKWIASHLIPDIINRLSFGFIFC